MQEYIERVTEGNDLTQQESRDAAKILFENATDAQIGALLTALRSKGETEGEIAGFAEGMRDVARRIHPKRDPLVDTCGTGGDGKNTINVSTASAIVASGAGVAIAKHGNYSVSSSSGSADVLSALGVGVNAEPELVEASIEKHGIGFMLAPVFHPAMKAVIGPRKELGMRTIFNILGPLTNPAGASAQTIGVYSEELVPLVSRALKKMNVKNAMVVHGSGLDEITIHDSTYVSEIEKGKIKEYTITPEEFGIDRSSLKEIKGGSPEENASDILEIIDGKLTGAKLDIILLNSAAAIYVSGIADSMLDGIECAQKSIADGSAKDKLSALKNPEIDDDKN
ncbi:MAG TPA: anthranilate phosphoribosyltransferase [Halobacteriales archaeon]|jgi:anthranilate phosphoribosyltransferase|nr:anthranilate phosphoribosyltransferase [Halobacteriales archaeon]